MKVIGAVGLNGAGKDELVDYLHRRCGIPALTVGDIVRDIAEEEDVEPTRDNLHAISERYMAQHDRDYFMQRLINKIEEEDWEVVGISGIRTPTDAQALREHFGDDLLLVHVQVNNSTLRFIRTKERGKARDPRTYSDFKQQDEAEEEMFRVSGTIEQADVTIRNDDSLEAFYQRIEETIIRQALPGCHAQDQESE